MKIGLVVNWNKPLADNFIPGLVAYLKRKKIEVAIIDYPPPKLKIAGVDHSRNIDDLDLILALGGDGTLLRAVRLAGRKGKPIMGVNLGSLGFLTEFSLREARRGISAFLNGSCHIEQRMLVRVKYDHRSSFAFNDCAINMGKSGRVIEIAVEYGSTFVNKFAGDGLIIATPTGSTAYSLAAGGPVVYPTLSALVLTPICPHALAARPIVLPVEQPVRLRLTGKSLYAILNLDGQVRWRITPEKPITITQADFTVPLVVHRKKSYFEILRNKLNWAGSRQI